MSEDQLGKDPELFRRTAMEHYQRGYSRLEFPMSMSPKIKQAIALAIVSFFLMVSFLMLQPVKQEITISANYQGGLALAASDNPRKLSYLQQVDNLKLQFPDGYNVTAGISLSQPFVPKKGRVEIKLESGEIPVQYMDKECLLLLTFSERTLLRTINDQIDNSKN